MGDNFLVFFKVFHFLWGNIVFRKEHAGCDWFEQGVRLLYYFQVLICNCSLQFKINLTFRYSIKKNFICDPITIKTETISPMPFLPQIRSNHPIIRQSRKSNPWPKNLRQNPSISATHPHLRINIKLRHRDLLTKRNLPLWPIPNGYLSSLIAACPNNQVSLPNIPRLLLRRHSLNQLHPFLFTSIDLSEEGLCIAS